MAGKQSAGRSRQARIRKPTSKQLQADLSVYCALLNADRWLFEATQRSSRGSSLQKGIWDVRHSIVDLLAQLQDQAHSAIQLRAKRKR